MAMPFGMIDCGIEVLEPDTSLQRSYGKEQGNFGDDRMAVFQSKGQFPSSSFKIHNNPQFQRSHCRFLTWVAYCRNLSSKVSEDQKRTCPLIDCEKSFETSEDMLKHVCNCPSLPKRLYRCYECEEEKLMGSCHTAGCQVLRQRFAIVINSLRLAKKRLSRRASRSGPLMNELLETPVIIPSITKSPALRNNYCSKSDTIADTGASFPRDNPHCELETKANVPELFSPEKSIGSLEHDSNYVDYEQTQVSEMADTSYFPMPQIVDSDPSQPQSDVWEVPDTFRHQTEYNWLAQINAPSLPLIDTNTPQCSYLQTPDSAASASTNTNATWDQSCFSPIPTSSTSDTSMSSVQSGSAAAQSYEQSETFLFDVTEPNSMSDEIYFGEDVLAGYSSSSLTPIAISWPVQHDMITSRIDTPNISQSLVSSRTSHLGGPQTTSFRAPVYHRRASLQSSVVKIAPSPALNINSAPNDVRSKFRCHGCGFVPNGCGAYYASNMKRHKETCPRYTGNSLLKRHTCPSPGCGKGYTRVDNLRVHQKSKGHILAEIS